MFLDAAIHLNRIINKIVILTIGNRPYVTFVEETFCYHLKTTYYLRPRGMNSNREKYTDKQIHQ